MSRWTSFVPEIYLVKIQCKMYNLLKSHHPETNFDFEGLIERQGDEVLCRYSADMILCDKKKEFNVNPVVELVRSNSEQIEKTISEKAEALVSWLINKHKGEWKCFAGMLIENEVSSTGIKSQLVYGIV